MKINQRKAGTVLSYVYIIVVNTVSLIYTPYMLRMLGQSEYGLFGIANSFIAYLSILSFGVGGAYIRFNARARTGDDPDAEKKLNGMFLTIFSVLSVLVLIGGLLFIYFAGYLVKDSFSADELYKLRLIMLNLTLNTMVTFIFNVVSMALMAYERFVFIRLCLLVMGILNPIVNVFVMLNGGKAVELSIVSLLISVFTYLLYYIYARKSIKMRFKFKGMDKSLFKEVFVFSGFLLLNSLTDQLTFSTDNLVLSAVGGTTVVAVYTVGSNFKNYFMNFSSAISSVFAPQINQIVAINDRSDNSDNTELNNIFVKVGRVQFLVVSLIIVGYLSIGQAFVRLWAGENYGDAFIIGLLLMLAIFVPCFQNVGIEIQKAKNMHKARSIAYFLVAIVNVIITIPFSMMWGGIGAALATTICMFIGTVLFMNYYYYKYVKLDVKRFWKEIFKMIPGFIPTLAVGFCINRFFVLNSFIKILLAAIVLIVVFAVSVWFLSLNSYEKQLFKAPINKIVKKFKRS